MNEEQAKIQIMAAAYAAASAVGINRAVELLREAASKLTDVQWQR